MSRVPTPAARPAARPVIVAAAVAALALAGVIGVPAAASAVAPAGVRITEFAYGGKATGSSTGGDGEYVEVTNLGTSSIDMTGWTYNRDTGGTAISLTGLGTLAAGASGIITDLTPAEFRTEWNLAVSVPVVNDGSTKLDGGAHTISLYDPTSAVADQVSWASGFLSAKGLSAWVDAAHVGAEAGTTGWTISTVGDAEGSVTSVHPTAIGSPGTFTLHTPPADVKFTEFAYGGKITGSSTGGDGEYVEVTNLGSSAVDMTGWTYNRDTGGTAISLTGLGTLAAGASGIITDVTAAEFRTEWNLAGSVPVVNDGSTKLDGGAHTISLYDPTIAIADQVTWASGFVSAKGLSAWVDQTHVGAKAGTTGWTISAVGDAEGSVASVHPTAIGSPGTFVLATPTGGGGTTPPPTDPNFADIVINEITSDNGVILPSPLPTMSDVVELYNTGTHTVSLDGWKQVDSGAATAAAVFSGALYVNGVLATSIPSHSFGVFQSTAGLSSGGDSVKVYTPDGILVDQLDYLAGQAGVDETVNTDHAYNALAACPDGSNSFLEVATASFGSSNAAACATGIPPLTSGTGPEAPCQTENSGDDPGTVPDTALTWPGGATPTTIDAQCSWVTTESGQDLSGLAFDPTNANVLYAVKNKSHVYRLINSGGTWSKDTANGWTNGKDIRFPGGTGAPDSEGMTVGPDGALYITTERDNNNSSVPLDTILRFADSSATTLTATDQWTLTSDLGFSQTDAADSNLGFEGVTFVPDSFLTSSGFRTDAGTLYSPANYPGKALPGLFFAAVEKTGHLIAYALSSDHSFVRVADIASGMLGVMDDQFDPDLGEIWAHCDNTCGNATALLKIGSDGHFTVDRYFARPANLPNYNLEGFAVAPLSAAVNGQRQVLWTDDGDRFGHSLWSGTIPATLLSPVVTLSTSNPAQGQTITVTVAGLTPGTQYEADLHSSPVLLGTGVAGSTGVLSLSVKIPSSTAAGAHTITISPAGSPGTIVASLALTVSGRLAATGVDPGSGLAAGAALLLLGIAAMRVRRGWRGARG